MQQGVADQPYCMISSRTEADSTFEILLIPTKSLRLVLVKKHFFSQVIPTLLLERVI